MCIVICLIEKQWKADALITQNSLKYYSHLIHKHLYTKYVYFLALHEYLNSYESTRAHCLLTKHFTIHSKKEICLQKYICNKFENV